VGTEAGHGLPIKIPNLIRGRVIVETFAVPGAGWGKLALTSSQ